VRWFCVIAIAVSSITFAEDLLPEQHRSSGQDALYGQSLFSLHSGDYQTALGLNQSLQKRQGKKTTSLLKIQQATAMLGLGMSQQAQKQYKKLLRSKINKNISSTTRAQAWFYLAKHFYDKGMWKTALQAIHQINVKDINPRLKDEFHFIAATLELFEGKASLADKHILAITTKSMWSAYAFLNLAISYTERDVHTSKVEAVFEKAKMLTKYTAHPESLVDKINLMAGQFFFATGRGRSAIKHLKEVSLEGAFTSKALLTYGWALTEQWQYHDAMQPWYMLKTNHSPLNQDVQETLIAIPHLLEKLNAKVMALGAFDYASEQYDLIYTQLEASALRLNTGEFIEPLLAQQLPDKWGAFFAIDLSLPDHPDRIYLKDVMSQSYFQGELKNLRDLHVMRSQLKSGIEQLDAFSQVQTTRAEEYFKIKNDKRINLTSRQLLNINKRYTSLQAKANKAFKNPSGIGFASELEKLQLVSFKELKSGFKTLDEQTHYLQRLRRVEGVLKWSLAQRYEERKKEVSKNLAILDKKIKQTRNQLNSAKLSFRSSPKSFKGFDKRVTKLANKYKNQLTRLDVVYQQQREKVGGIVKLDIKERQKLVMDYQLQARLASARLFDETSNKHRVAAGSEFRQ
jgi:hypothetical protein